MNEVMPPDYVFLNPRRPLEEVRAWHIMYGFKRFSFPEKGGLLTHFAGRQQPNKGLPYTAVLEANNTIKRLSIGLVLMLKPKRQWLSNLLSHYVRMADYAYTPHYFHYRYYNDFSREMFGFTYRFSRKLGFSFDLSYSLGRIVATLFEYDNGYRLRAEDLFTLITKAQLLKNPRKTLKWVGEVYSQREKYKGLGIEESFRFVIKGLRILLLVPKVKTAFRFALADSKFENFQLDDIDKFWADKFEAYDFGGEPYGIRQLKQSFKTYGS